MTDINDIILSTKEKLPEQYPQTEQDDLAKIRPESESSPSTHPLSETSTSPPETEASELTYRLDLSLGHGAAANTLLRVWSPTFPEFCARFERAPVGTKDGDYLVRGPSIENRSTRSDANIDYACLLVIDGDCSVNPLTAEITPGAPDPNTAHQALKDLGLAHVIHTTFSHELPEKGNRWRAYLPVFGANKIELRQAITFLIHLLHQEGVFVADVKENYVWSQCWYLPRLPNSASNYQVHSYLAGHGLDMEAAQEWYESSDRPDPESHQGTSPQPGPETLFDRFNAQYGTSEWMLQKLEANGYTQKGTSRMNGGTAYRLLSPQSNSGTPGVVLFLDQKETWRVHSHHNATDLLSGAEGKVSSHDAWDLFRIFDYGGDQQAAIAAFESGCTPSIAGTTGSHVFKDIDEARQLNPSGFPHVVTKGPMAGALKETLPNLKHLLEEYGVTARYNVIAKKEVIAVPGQSGSPDNADNTALAHIVSLAKLNGLPTSQIQSYLSALADKNQYNPVAAYITSREWDQQDRLGDLLDALTTKEGFSIDLKSTIFLRWLISCVAAACMPTGFKSRGVLVLQGPQSIGKTSFFLSLVDDPLLRERVIKIDHHLDASNKDSILTASQHWLVEIGELDSSFKKDVARLKGYITASTDKVRRPYDRRDSEYPRRTVFCASVNSANFLVDDTGNTRWWTLPVTKINYEHGINMQQLWAQVHEIYASGEQWWLTPEEERQLEEYNRDYRTVSVIRDLLDTKLDFSRPQSERSLATATEVLIAIGVKTPTNAQARDCGTYLREKLGEPTLSKGRTRWPVPFEKNPFDEYS